MLYAGAKLYAEAKLEKVTITMSKSVLEKHETHPYFVMSRENEEGYIPRWYTAAFETFSEAMDDFAKIVKEAEEGERPWGTGGVFSGMLSS